MLLRYSLIGELDLKSLEVVPRIISQFEPRIGGTKNPQASIPPPQVIRPPPPAIQQQQQAAAAAKKKAAVTAARLSSDNLNSLASGQSSAQLAMKAGKPVKGEEDPKAAAVKMLMREAAKGAQQIQQMSSQLQQQAQMRNQQALQGSFQPQLQQALPLLAGQLGSQNAAQIIQGAQASMPAALGSPVMGNGQVQQQTPGSPALNGPMISPTKLASNQGVKNTLLAAGVLGSTPATSPGNSPAAALQGAQNAAALQQQAQRVQMIRSRQQQAAAAGGAQGSAALTQANVAAAQTMLLNQLRPGAQVKIPGTGNVQAMLSGANAAFAASNGVNSSPPRSNVSAAHVTPAMLAQLQARLAMAGNAGLLANAAAAGALNAGQHGGDGGAMDDDESK